MRHLHTCAYSLYGYPVLASTVSTLCTWILDECSKFHLWNSFVLTGSISKLYWACICVIFTWAMTKLLANHFFVCYQFFFVVASCIRYYLDNLLARVGNRRKSFSTPEMIRIYRQLQLMIRFFNGVNSDVFTSIFIFIIGVACVVSLFAFIAVKSAMSIPQFVILGSAAGQVVICMGFGYGIFGGIDDDSIQTLQAFRTSNACLESRIEQKVCAKLVKALSPLKVMIGSVNYVDKLTPITLIDFFLGILVNLLLLK